MKRIIVCFALVILTSTSFSQWLWDYGVALGASNYLGDIGGKESTRRDFVSDMKLEKTRWNTGVFLRYKWLPRLSFKTAFNYLRLEGDDKLSANPGRQYRNLNFRNDVFDLAATAEFYFFENNDLGNTYRYKNSFRAYVFGGIGAFHSNPKGYYNGEWVQLQPLKTEGVAYNLYGLNVPVGVGFFFTLNKRHRLGWELNWRTTFTDYIDDISGNYPDNPGTFSNRTSELGSDAAVENPGAYYYFMNKDGTRLGGMKRGDPKHNDSYMTMNFSYSFVIRGRSSSNPWLKGKGSIGNIKVRKIRAKF